MVTHEALDAALEAHGKWKARLRDAIATGHSEFTVDVVKRDNACEFGRWLEMLSPQDKKSDDYLKVKNLHATFHQTAAEILALALAGKKEQAIKLLEFGGKYGNDSGGLVLALNQWKAKL